MKSRAEALRTSRAPFSKRSTSSASSASNSSSSPDGHLLINELAPRPHNSGHLTFDASVTSQFEQQLRAVCGLPLGSTELLRPAAMANLLGDLWQPHEPNWQAALAHPDVKLHLYGKLAPRPGRKMGHLTALAADPQTALDRVQAARSALTNPCETHL